MTATPEHAPPASLADVYTRLRELAPDPDPAATDPTGTLTRYLAARTWYRWAKDQAQPDEILSADAYAALTNGFGFLHAFRALEIARPMLAAAVAREIASARADAGDVGEILHTHLTLLGVDAGEIKRLAEAAAALERAKTEDDIEPPRDENDCACLRGGACPCDADGDDGYCSCCRNEEHNGSCEPVKAAALRAQLPSVLTAKLGRIRERAESALTAVQRQPLAHGSGDAALSAMEILAIIKGEAQPGGDLLHPPAGQP